ncbi:MAG: DMT family transporter [Chloroflexi bacterium]|nr:DMT family transporter [Chloroflexota bacterium]
MKRQASPAPPAAAPPAEPQSSPPPPQRSLRGWAYGALAAAIWGGMYVVSDVILITIPPFSLLTLRLLLGLAVLLPLLLRQNQASDGRNSLWPNRHSFRANLAVGALGFGFSLGAQLIGTELSTAINGTTITSASPAFILLFAWPLLGERWNLRSVLALVLASVGVLIILDLRQLRFGAATALGDLALAIAALSWGLYSVLVRRLTTRDQLRTVPLTVGVFLGGLLVSTPLTIWELLNRSYGAWDLPFFAGLLYLGIVSTAWAQWLWNRAFALLPAARASLCFFAQPFAGALLAMILLQQALTPALALGGGMIAVGVLLAVGEPAE